MAFLLTNSQSHVIPHTHPTSDINWLTELIQANAVVVSATAPENPTSGKLWYNTTKGVFNIYNWSSWILVWPEVTPITKAQYDALSNDDKNDGRFYLITDNDGTIIVDWANVENKPTIPTSLWELSGTSDDVTEGSSHLFMTPAERTNLWNQSWVNTGDQSASDFDIKDLADTTNLRSTWSWKQDAINDLDTIRSWASAWATAVQPNDNVSTLTNDAWYITNAVNDLTNYYTKTQTYTKAEVDQMISEFGWFEVVETLPTEDIRTNVIYLKGPIGTWGDKYEEWIYSNNDWVLIGETSVDLSNYFNTFTDNSDRITEGSTNLFVTPSEKTVWNAKQDALVSWTNIKTVNGNSLLWSGDVVIPLGKNDIVRSTLPPQDTTVLWYDTVNFVLNYYNDNAWKSLWVVNGWSVEPDYNITGNLWYDINNNVLRVYRVWTWWKDLAYWTSSSAAPTTVSAWHIWYDTTNNILKVYNGTAWEDVNTNTTYTAWVGIDITNGEISVDTTIVATKTDLASKQDTISDLATIRSNAASGKSASDTIAAYWDVVTHDASEFATTAQWALADTAIQPGDNVSDLTNDAWYITSAALPTKTSDLTNDSWFITNAVNDLVNYYTKTETYTKTEVDNLVASVWSFEVVDTLPSVSTADTKKIYLLGPIWTGADKYEEWIVTESEWVKQWTKIWETSIDLSGYATTTALTNWLSTKQDTLVSGTNIKTINNTSLLGNGNIDISAWDMLYADYNWVTKTGSAITMNLNSVIEPSANFTVYAPNFIKDWQIYLLRVNNGATAYTMTLGSHITNPYSVDTTLKANSINQFTFLAVDWNLELQPTMDDTNTTYTAWTWLSLSANNEFSVDTTVVATKTDLNSKQDTLVSGTNIKTINNNSLLGSGNINIPSGKNDIYIWNSAPSDTTVLWFDTVSTSSDAWILKYYANEYDWWIEFLWVYNWTEHPDNLNLLWYDTDTYQLKICNRYDSTWWQGIATIHRWSSEPENYEEASWWLWFDTNGYKLKYYNNYNGWGWQPVGWVIELSSAPYDTRKLWYDTTNDVMKYYDGSSSSWKPIVWVTYTAWYWINITSGEISVDTSDIAWHWLLTDGNSNLIVDTTVIQEKLTAWEGISITGWTVCTTESDRKGPAPSWFHVPSTTEWQWVKTIMDWLSLTTWDNWRINLHIPFAGCRFYLGSDVTNQSSSAYLWSSTPTPNGDDARYIVLNSSNVKVNQSYRRADGYSIRAFANEYVEPDNNWTAIQWTLWWPWIFRNQIDWLISITLHWDTWYTLQDKNLWATIVYNDWDTLTQDNMGNMYQWWNNYWFPSTGSVTTSSTQVDASWYWPGNYYESNTFITWNGDWSSVHNDDLWWNTSNSTHQECTAGDPLTISSTAKWVTVWTTAPSNPSAWDLWYDTTSTVLALKVYNGSAWEMVWPEVVPITQAAYDALTPAEKNNGKFYLITNASGTISVDWSNVANKSVDVSTQTWTLSSVKIWVWSQTDYEALTTKDPNTLYFTTNVVSGS